MKITGRTKILGVIGDPVGHSLSPVMHNAAIESLGLDYVYVPFHILPSGLADAVAGFRTMQVSGINATIPHKVALINLLDDVSQISRQTGSVNTIINNNGRLLGDTTDGAGFLHSAQDQWGSLANSRALILGAGGSARAVCVALVDIGCRIIIANRTLTRAQALAEMLMNYKSDCKIEILDNQSDDMIEAVGSSDLIVNTTSVGMSPKPDGIPLNPDLLKPSHLVYDLIYSPLDTRLVSEARNRGASAASGLRMLVYQGAESFKMWTGIYPPVDIMEKALLEVINR